MDPLVMKADTRFRELSAEDEARKSSIPENLLEKAQEEFIQKSGGTNDTTKIKLNQQEMNEPKEIKTKPEKVPTATQTFTLIQEGRSIEDIAQHR